MKNKKFQQIVIMVTATFSPSIRRWLPGQYAMTYFWMKEKSNDNLMESLKKEKIFTVTGNLINHLSLLFNQPITKFT